MRPTLALPDPARVERALRRVPLRVHQDIIVTDQMFVDAAEETLLLHAGLEGVEKASVSDSKKVVEICTIYAQRGMFNIFLTVFFATLAFAFFYHSVIVKF